jgi:DoxX-like protein
MDTLTEPPASASRSGSTRWRSAGYWLATVLVAAELAVGGAWDIARIPSVHSVVVQLGYPSYFLVLLGSWKVLGAAALVVPRRALLKEWAYAGAFFTYTGAIVSHLTTGYALGEVPVLALLTALIALSWALRPPQPPHVYRAAGRRGPRHPGRRAGTFGDRARGRECRSGHRGRGRALEEAMSDMTRTLSLIIRNLVLTVVVPGLGSLASLWIDKGHTIKHAGRVREEIVTSNVQECAEGHLSDREAGSR